MPVDPKTEEFGPDPLERRITAPSDTPANQNHDRAFNSNRFKFEGGVPVGKTAHVRNGDGEVLLTYRGFASVVTIVAALVAGIIVVAGVAAALFLIAERHPLPAIAVIVLAIAFSGFIAALVPRTRVVLLNDDQPALVIDQRSRTAFPRTSFAIKTPEGETIALVGRSVLSRLGRNSWSIDWPANQRGSAFAVEESLGRAIVRKFIGKFNRAHEANIRIFHGGVASGVIVRRPDQTGEADYLDLAANGTLDRRVAVALATLVFGAEP